MSRTTARQLGERLPEPAAAAAARTVHGPVACARRGEYRVRYRIDDSDRIAYVVDLDHRRDAYRS